MEETQITQEAELRAAMTRRKLLRDASLTVGGVLAAEIVSATSADALDKTPKIILGSGSHKYECVHDWLVLPNNVKWGDTQGVCQDSKGHIYISHTVGADSQSKDAIAVFDRKGKFIKTFGSRFAGGGHGIEVRKEGSKEYLYHCDTAHRQVVKTDLDGNVIWEKGLPTESGVYQGGAAFIPTNVTFAPNGDFYVADGYGSNWVHQFNIKGDLVRTWGGSGSANGKLSQPHGIWVDTRGSEPLVMVCDRGNNRLHYFTLDGKFVRIDKDGMRQPCHADIQDGHMLIPDLAGVVTVLDENNKVAVHLGDSAGIANLPGRGRARTEFLPGKFVHPHGAKFLANGDILVGEWLPIGRVTLLKRIKA